MDLDGRVALVTGGAAGAGATIVQRLAAGGATVVVADVDDGAGRRAIDTLGAASFVRTDVRVDGDVEHMVAFAEERHGGVDILVNNAGGWGPTANYPFASPLQWGSTLDLNLRAPMLATSSCSSRCAGAAAARGQRRLDRRGRPRALLSPEYGAAKAGLIRFTACMAYAREETGVRVNCVVPDWIATERAQGELAAMTPEQREAEEPSSTPTTWPTRSSSSSATRTSPGA